MFSRLTLRFKLIIAFLAVAFLLAGASYWQIFSVQHLNDLFVNLSDNDIKRSETVDQLRLAGVTLHAKSLQYQQALNNGSASEQQSTKTAMTTQISVLKTAAQNYTQLLKEDTIAAEQSQNFSKQVQEVITTSTALSNATAKTPAATLSNLLTQATSAQDSLDATTISIAVAEQKGIDSENNEIAGTISRIVTTTIGLAIAAVVVAVLLGFLIANLIGRSLSQLRRGAERIANGNFSQSISIKSQDEIGQLAIAFNLMTTRLRDSYRRLAVETERDRTLLESLGEGVIAIDAGANIVLLNDKAVEMLELPSRAELLGANVTTAFELADEKGKPLLSNQNPARVALQTAQASSLIYGFHKKAGIKILLNINTNPIVVNEKIVGVIMTLRDVTKEREIDRMKTEFISLASHQLRTPLSAIKWFTEMLVSGDAGQLQPEQLDFAKNISDSTERMIALVNALLNISRIESGRILIDPKPTDLRILVSGIVNDLKAKIDEKQQTLAISVHQDLPPINIDPRLIGQVYLNLLTNAIKYTPKGGEISVFISKKDDQVISQVTDSGYGIPKEQQARVFQKFFRATNAVKIETDGTGLGLYLIKAVVESSGGKIWFESEEGKGTTFWFSIPLSGMKPKEGEVTLDA